MRNDMDILNKSSDHKITNQKIRTKNTDIAESYFYQDFIKDMPFVDSNLRMNEHYQELINKIKKKNKHKPKRQILK